MTQDGETSSLAEVLCALSFATDTSMGQAGEHGRKSGYIGLRIADRLHLGEEDRQGVFYGALIKDAGAPHAPQSLPVSLRETTLGGAATA